ncbi:hypothetical protein BGZ93_008955, partial [Podila epicladia]
PRHSPASHSSKFVPATMTRTVNTPGPPSSTQPRLPVPLPDTRCPTMQLLLPLLSQQIYLLPSQSLLPRPPSASHHPLPPPDQRVTIAQPPHPHPQQRPQSLIPSSTNSPRSRPRPPRRLRCGWRPKPRPWTSFGESSSKRSRSSRRPTRVRCKSCSRGCQRRMAMTRIKVVQQGP